MESVMWAFKTLWDKGLVYEGYKVLPYCWRCETPLSNTETRMDDVYKDRRDPAITVAFTLSTGEHLLAWTTTPWTLPSNLAVAVVPTSTTPWSNRRTVTILAKPGSRPTSASSAALPWGHAQAVISRALLHPLRSSPTNRRVPLLAAVSAPSTGQRALSSLAGHGGITGRVQRQRHRHRGYDGSRAATVRARLGRHQFFEANPLVIRDLKERGLVLRQETYDHSYPHCWRCGQPLVYRAISSWFVQVTAFKDRMVELNREITWVPTHVGEGSFGKWLENARDWSISRSRFWGSPIPVWKSDDPAYPRIDVYGGLDQLRRRLRCSPTDLHRPMVDELVRRIPRPERPLDDAARPDVLDCWFESGRCLRAGPLTLREPRVVRASLPGRFIVEYISHTRGWFYTFTFSRRPVRPSGLSHVRRPRTCWGATRRMFEEPAQLSRSVRHVRLVRLRCMLCSAVVEHPAGQRPRVTEPAIRARSPSHHPLWNTWYFFTLYANSAGEGGYRARFRTDQDQVLDRYVLAKLHDLVTETTAAMDAYDFFAACAAIRSFLDTLTNWYIRRSRDRFWVGDAGAFDTLFTALHVLCRVAAPLLPLVTEEVFTGLTDARSVHLADWPVASEIPADASLVRAMDRVRDVCSVALSIRKANGLRVRLPLASLTVAVPDAESLAPFVSIIAEEVNVKEVHLTSDVGAVATSDLALVPAVLGPRLGAQTQKVILAAKGGDWTRADDGAVSAGGVVLQEGEYAVRLVPIDSEASASYPEARESSSSNWSHPRVDDRRTGARPRPCHSTSTSRRARSGE